MENLKIRWQNFHAFEDTGWIEFKPLTILIGPNNSGKSSLLLPLLLLKQTSRSTAKHPYLVSRGPIVNAGGYEDLVTDGDINRQITFDVQYNTSVPTENRHLGHYPPGQTSLGFSAATETEVAELTTYRIYDLLKRKVLERRKKESGRYSLSGVPQQADRRERANEGVVNTLVDRELRKLIRNSVPYNLKFPAGELFSKALKELPDTVEDQPNALELSDFSAEYLRIVETAGHELHHFLWEISPIGPLREPPQRFYEISGEEPASVGLKGEYAPEILFRRTDDELVTQVNYWLQRFEFAKAVQPKRLAEGVFCLTVGLPDGGTVNAADVGFGLSQTLPFVVQSVLSRPGELTLAVQPEIHLNPKLQASVADLLQSTVDRGSRVVVETHSEHLLLRLRRLVAEGILDPQLLGIYYVEVTGGRSSVREIPIKSNGHIEEEEWPKGFFGDALKEAMALTRAQLRGRHV